MSACTTCAPTSITTTATTTTATTVPPAAPRPAPTGAAPTHGGARFVGDAAPIGGIPLSRIFDAACYVITGIALFVMTGQTSTPVWITVLLGLAALGYGIKILATRSSYWVSSIVYAVTFIAVCLAVTAISK
jgi:hypothetical protein